MSHESTQSLLDWSAEPASLFYAPPPCVKIYSQINITDGKCAHHPFFGQPALHHLLAWRGSASGHGLEITGRDADLGSGGSCQAGQPRSSSSRGRGFN